MDQEWSPLISHLRDIPWSTSEICWKYKGVSRRIGSSPSTSSTPAALKILWTFCTQSYLIKHSVTRGGKGLGEQCQVITNYVMFLTRSFPQAPSACKMGRAWASPTLASQMVYFLCIMISASGHLVLRLRSRLMLWLHSIVKLHPSTACVERLLHVHAKNG